MPAPTDASLKVKGHIQLRFPNLHPSLCGSLASDLSWCSNEELVSVAAQRVDELVLLCEQLEADTLKGLSAGDAYPGASVRLDGDKGHVPLPGGKAQPAAYAALRQHEDVQDQDAKIASCLHTLRLMSSINVVIEETKALLINNYPKSLTFQTRLLEAIPDEFRDQYAGIVNQGDKGSNEFDMRSMFASDTTPARTPESATVPKRRSGRSSHTGRSAGCTDTPDSPSLADRHDHFKAESVVGTVEFNLERENVLDAEGRPVYRNTKEAFNRETCYLAWHRGKFGGHWSMHTDIHGEGHGLQAKWAPLPFDPGGHWTTAPEADTEAAEAAPRPLRYSVLYDHSGADNPVHGQSVSSLPLPDDEMKHAEALAGRAATPTVRRLLESRMLAKLQRSTRPEQIWDTLMVYPERADLVQMCAQALLRWRPELREMVIRLLRAVLDIVVLLEGCPRQPSLGESEVEQAEEMVFLLEQLAALAEGINNDDWERRLAAELPGFPFELSWVQLMILNCRLFGLSRIRNPTYPMSLIRIHDFVFRSWQRSHLRHGPKAEVVTAVRYLDLESQTLQSLAEPPPRKEGHMRFVVISDTHGWSVAMPCGDGRGRGREDLSFGRIILPEGDVLLHCGDLLNEGEVLQLMDDAGSNTKLAEELAHLKSVSCQRGSDGSSSDDAEGSPRRFKWVFIVGGNHDAPIFMLAANGKLTDMMGDSMVLLQSAADFEASNPLDRDVPRVVNSVAKSAGVRAKVVNGAVRILPDGSLSPPHESVDRGVVLAGSGLSLANNAWTANRAFQIQRHESWKLRSAAESLMTFRPDIVMTHGPPAGYSDEGKGDQQLREALDEPDCSVKLHLFGHAHSGGMGCDGRPWQIHGRDFPGRCFVNCALATSLYMPIRLPIVFDWPMVAQDAPKVPAPPMTPTTTEVAEPVARFGACHGCALGTQ